MKNKMTGLGLALLTMISILSLPSCSKNGHGGTAPSKIFVLVHGSWQAPWVWDQVKENLEKT